MTPHDSPLERQGDRKLVQFLRQYRPTVPPAAANLEDQLMAALDTRDWEQPPIARREPAPSTPWYQRRRRWVVAGTILTASLFATWMGQRAWQMAQTPSPAEIAEIEQFMEQSWQGVVVSHATDGDNPLFTETSSAIGPGAGTEAGMGAGL